MAARWGRLIAFAVAAGLPLAAASQTIPSSEQPGRERERFVDEPAPRARPSAPIVLLQGTAAPEGAASVRLVLAGVEVLGSTIYDRQGACGALYRSCRDRSDARDRLRHSPARHRKIWPGRLCPVARHRAAAGAGPGGRRRAPANHRRLCRPRRMAGHARSLPRCLFRLCREDYRRPAGERAHHRALPAPGERSAGPRIPFQPAPLRRRDRRVDAGG